MEENPDLVEGDMTIMAAKRFKELPDNEKKVCNVVGLEKTSKHVGQLIIVCR